MTYRTKFRTTPTPTQIIPLKNVLADRFDSLTEDSGIFGVTLWFTPIVGPSFLTATFAKLDAQISQGLFLIRVIKFLAEIIEIVEPTGSVGHPLVGGVHDPQ